MFDQQEPGEPTGGVRSALDGTVDITRDRTLVERCQAGDQAAFGELYTRYRRRLVTFCQRRLRDPHEAEDAAQEAFARAWRAIPNFSGERRFYPWLTVIARNVCTDVSRKRSRTSPVAEVPLPAVDLGVVDVDEAIIAMADATMAAEALDHVSERHARVLRLREGSGWSTERLAEHEGMAVPAVETLLWRARQSLKREFAALADAGGRLGVAVGFGLAALRRFVWRSTARVADRLPALQQLSPSLRSPVAMVAGLALAGGIVGGTVVAVGSSTPKSPSAPTALAAAGNGNFLPLLGSTSQTAQRAGSGSGATGFGSGSTSASGTTVPGGVAGAGVPGVSVPGASVPVGGSSGTPTTIPATVGGSVVTPITKAVVTPITKKVVTPITQNVVTPVTKAVVTKLTKTVVPVVTSTVGTVATKAATAASKALTTPTGPLGTTLTTLLNPLGQLVPSSSSSTTTSPSKGLLGTLP